MNIQSILRSALVLVQLNFLSVRADAELPTAAPGTAARAYLEVPDTGDGMTRIPVSVFRGDKDGPTLALIAGTHGYEYAPMVALQHVGRRINPKDLSGTLIMVHVANMPSFHQRTIYYGPVDGKNLNRAYPGKPDGTLSERIAHIITTQVIEKADYVIDMHSGDGNEALRPYIYMPRTGDLQLDAKIKSMALAFGIDHIVIDERPVSAPDATVFTDMTALSRGIPSMTTEAGQLGSTDPHWVDINVMGAMNVMRHLGMLPGEVIPPKPTVWLKGYQVVTSPENGFFRPAVKDGYAIAEGGILGELVDHFGTHIATIHAPFAGVVNYVVATPPVRFGEPLAMVSKLAEEEN
ncbi:MAG: succinylglutamate desuccinylase/aspartoacylase family protein [Kordiimonadaceae bacterium]|nr:succinylglutamate desuccinylase/aspartoacylase family protein [Kordiimonadaceae bacterium]MBO6568872.1 succinylglutamate desuccinylase/aspartoacylase family protein [Kordiimonadaceae bacterium]MBO6965153.1 succinylglutamate desuccinylase/aspartoacylase family protein [Kordiimonadaceae bacterium]